MATLIQTGFTKNPYKPFPYSGSQAITVSDRIQLNAKRDSIMLFGNNSIGLSSKGTINLESREYTIIQSPYILLGNQATEPLVKGEELKNMLITFANKMKLAASQLTSAAKKDQNTGNVYAEGGNITLAGQFINSACGELISDIDKILSQKSYTE